MKFIEVEQFGGPEQLRMKEAETPSPEKGQLLVEVKASGINFADLLARMGYYTPVPSAPFRPGFEVAGVVSKVGEGSEGFQVGQRVMAMVHGGGYASHAVVDATNAIPLPDSLDFAAATALLVQGLTAYFLLEAAQLKAGGTVLIPSAAGGVGSLAIQIAKLKGSGRVIGLASPSKHERVRAWGADEVFDYTQKGWSQLVKDATGGQGVDIYLDSQGDPAGEGRLALADEAHWMVYGGQGAASGGSLGGDEFRGLIFRNITIRGYTLYSDMAQYPRGLQELLGWATTGQLRIEADARFALEDAAKAHEAIANRQTSGKVVIEP